VTTNLTHGDHITTTITRPAHGGVAACLNYEGYPKSVCISVNDVVCHGIPSPDTILKEGDIVNIDITTILHGYFADASRMFMIGEVSPQAGRLQAPLSRWGRHSRSSPICSGMRFSTS